MSDERHRAVIAVVTTLVTVLGIEVVRLAGLDVPSPAALLFVTLVFATVYGGTAAGLVSAVGATGYYLWFYHVPGPGAMVVFDQVRVGLLAGGSFAVVGLIATLRRIIGQRDEARLVETQRSLSQTENRYRLLFNCVRDPVLVYAVTSDGRPGRIIAANDAAIELYGYSLDQLRQMTPRHIIAPSIDLQGKMQRLLDEGDIITPSIHIAADGRHIPCEVRSHRFDLDGQLTVLSIARDVTDRHGAERALRQERDFTAAVLDTIGAVVLVLDREGRIIRTNRAARVVSGYAAQDLVGVSVWERLVPADERVKTREVFTDLIATGGPNTARNMWKTRGGRLRLMEWSNTTIRDTDGQVLYVIGTAIDITERHEAEQALELYRNELERRVRARTAELAQANAALQEEVVQRQTAERQVREAHADLVHAEQRERQRIAHVLHDHLQQILVAARMRIEMQDHAAQRSDGDVLPILDEAIGVSRSLAVELCPPVLQDASFANVVAWLAEHMARQQQLTVELETLGEPRPLDEQVRVALFQALREVLFNVVKHAEVDVCHVQLNYGEEALAVRVTDEGVGFDSAAGRHDGGFGLGQIAHRLEMLGGELRIHSTPGEGTMVMLRAPLPEAPLSDAPGEIAAPADACDGHDPLPVRVAIADDHTLFRAGLVGLLNGRADLTVVGQASRGDEILKVAREVTPDVVLMDVNMPGLNGIEATEALKKAQPAVRVIGLSMHHEPDIAQRMLAAGAETYLVKDGPPEELIDAICGRTPAR